MSFIMFLATITCFLHAASATDTVSLPPCVAGPRYRPSRVAGTAIRGTAGIKIRAVLAGHNAVVLCYGTAKRHREISTIRPNDMGG